MTPRQLRRAAERRRNKLERKMERSVAIAARQDEAAVQDERAFLSEPNTQENDPAERVARKQERKAAVTGFVFSSPEPHDEIRDTAPTPPTISPSQLAANRANSHLSTGPKTPEGKAKSCLNAVKTGLTGRTVLLPSEDAQAYEQHIQDWFQDLKPVGPRECALAQSLTDTAWRMRRLPALEMAIFAFGRTQFAGQFDHEDSATRPGLIDLHTFLHYEKQIRNLQIQEGRLHRQFAKDTTELRQLQQERIKRQRQELETAAQLYTAAKQDTKPFNPAQYGFEFSTVDIEAYLARIRAANNASNMSQREMPEHRSFTNVA